MLAMLVLLGFMIAHASRPQTWYWLAQNEAQGAQGSEIPPVPTKPDSAPPEEVLVPNPTDQDPEEWKEVSELFRNVRDKIPMEVEEMPPYWRLFKWARAQTMQSLEDRSLKSPFFTQFWDQPDKMRGRLVTLRLRLRRVLSHEAPENSAGVKRVYEFWGVTDESRGHPYVVITSELPASIPEGANITAEAVFSGYFLKLLGYEASDAKRGAPLLIGRIRALPSAPSLLKDPKQGRSEFWMGLIAGSIILILLVISRLMFRGQQRKARKQLDQAIDEGAETWLGKGTPPGNAPPPLPPSGDA